MPVREVFNGRNDRNSNAWANRQGRPVLCKPREFTFAMRRLLSMIHTCSNPGLLFAID